MSGTMQSHELEAFLVPALDDLRDKHGTDGLDDMRHIIDGLSEAYDDEADRIEATNGAVMVALGDETLESLAAELFRLRQAEHDAMSRIVGAMHWQRHHDGASEAELVRATGLARATVRGALGL